MDGQRSGVRQQQRGWPVAASQFPLWTLKLGRVIDVTALDSTLADWSHSAFARGLRVHLLYTSMLPCLSRGHGVDTAGIRVITPFPAASCARAPPAPPCDLLTSCHLAGHRRRHYHATAARASHGALVSPLFCCAFLTGTSQSISVATTQRIATHAVRDSLRGSECWPWLTIAHATE